MAEEAKGKNTGMAILCYLGILILVPLLTDAKNEAFVKFHLGQGIVLIIASIAISVINVIPIIGQIISILGGLAVFILWIMGIINAAGGQEKELPVIGQYGAKFKL